MNPSISFKAILTNIRTNHIIAISIGIVYLWFGLLKFIAHASPAEDIAIRSMQAILGEDVSGSLLLHTLAVLEVFIGSCLLLNIYRKTIVKIALVHMGFTFIPLFVCVNESFAAVPIGLTLLGQYIMKNLIIIAALITLYKVKQNKRV